MPWSTLPLCVLIHTCVSLHHAYDDGNVQPGSISHTAHTTRACTCRLRTEHLANGQHPFHTWWGVGGSSWPDWAASSYPTLALGIWRASSEGSTHCISHTMPSQQGSKVPVFDKGLRGQMWPCTWDRRWVQLPLNLYTINPPPSLTINQL